MKAKVTAVAVLSILFVTFSTICYEIVISTTAHKLPYIVQLREIREVLTTSDNTTLIQLKLEESNEIYEIIKDDAITLHTSFSVIEYLSILNLAFLLQHMISFIFIKRLGRFYSFPSLTHITDSILFGCSIYTIRWFITNIDKDLNSDPNMTDMEFR